MIRKIHHYHPKKVLQKPLLITAQHSTFSSSLMEAGIHSILWFLNSNVLPLIYLWPSSFHWLLSYLFTSWLPSLILLFFPWMCLIIRTLQSGRRLGNMRLELLDVKKKNKERRGRGRGSRGDWNYLRRKEIYIYLISFPPLSYSLLDLSHGHPLLSWLNQLIHLLHLATGVNSCRGRYPLPHLPLRLLSRS